mmetsp:Transcript_7782/g.17075  ORF Transcript_7782/g.17075 Transcript_7782/m.17075 type:complete len:226 (+) Transcript_7782:154-831(+)
MALPTYLRPSPRWVIAITMSLEIALTLSLILVLVSSESMDTWLMFVIFPGIISCAVRLNDSRLPRLFAEPVLLLHIVEALVAIAVVSSTAQKEVSSGMLHICLTGLAVACLLFGDAAVVGIGFANRVTSPAPVPEPPGSRIPPKIATSTCQGPQDDACIICLEDVEAGDAISELPCGHFFHSQCLDSWVASRVRRPWCPLRCDVCVQPPPEVSLPGTPQDVDPPV